VPELSPAWPTNGPANVGGYFETIPAFGLPRSTRRSCSPRVSRSRSRTNALKAGNRRHPEGLPRADLILGLRSSAAARKYIHAYQERT